MSEFVLIVIRIQPSLLSTFMHPLYCYLNSALIVVMQNPVYISFVRIRSSLFLCLSNFKYNYLHTNSRLLRYIWSHSWTCKFAIIDPVLIVFLSAGLRLLPCSFCLWRRSGPCSGFAVGLVVCFCVFMLWVVSDRGCKAWDLRRQWWFHGVGLLHPDLFLILILFS